MAVRLYEGNNSASLMTSDRGNTGAAELDLNNTPVSLHQYPIKTSLTVTVSNGNLSYNDGVQSKLVF